jgi:SOS-response transcriptional repressor LexA
VVPGDPGKTRQQRIGELAVQPNQYRKSRYILKVRGDSMKPAIHSADLMLIDNGARARHRDIIACTINGESTLRRYERKCKCKNKDKCKCKSAVIVLKADNPSYDPIVVTRADTFTIHGVALEIVQRKLR